MKHIKVTSIWSKENTNFIGSVIDDDGDIAYYLNGQFHREDGPAIEWSSGYKAWYLYGKFHREGGPAIEDADEQWWYNDELISEDPDYTLEDFQREIKLRIFK